MLQTNRMKRRTLGLLLAGIVVGLNGTQAVALQATRYITSGLFTLHLREGVHFHVSLDDIRGGPVATVIMRIIDDTGVVQASRTVTLNPGQSATLTHDEPGRYRVQAEVYEQTLGLSARRNVVGGVEVFGLDDLTIHRIIPTNGESIPTDRN
jgi:hypothetical protein